MDRTYTLQEIVSALSSLSTADKPEQLARQLRYWTQSGLLSPVGKRNTGTGRSRRYNADEVRKAGILVELTHYRVPTPVLRSEFPVMSIELPRKKHWQEAIAATQQIFLYLSYGKKLITWQTVPHDLRSVLAEEPPEPEKLPFQLPASAIVVNLTRVFSRLKL